MPTYNIYQPTMLNYYNTININTAKSAAITTSVLVIYTGGTIGMDFDPSGKYLIPLDFSQILNKIPELSHFDIEITVLPFEQPIDSSDIKIHHWLNLARTIYDFYQDFDAFVILHGTDTMSYTASAVSFLLQNLGKPVIFTGSQLPIGAKRTDARENFISALEIAASRHEDGSPKVPEVCIFFANKLLRGNRSRKVQSLDFMAFESGNYPPLATAGIRIDYNYNLIAESPNKPFDFYRQMDSNVIFLKLFPGLQNNYIDQLLNMTGLRGVVLETFGSGNAPSENGFISVLENAIKRGIFIYNVSQCSGGSVIQGMYGTSRKLRDIGVISGGDITQEAAITKMMLLLGNSNDYDLIRLRLAEPMRGEMS
jgi:L-asparaginase